MGQLHLLDSFAAMGALLVVSMNLDEIAAYEAVSVV
jgi:hypothetical protein